MGNLEQFGENQPKKTELMVPSEVKSMEKNLIGKARVIFQNNHELVKEAMFGMGSRKAKEIMEQLAECREEIKEEVKKFKAEKEKIYPMH
jgi:hypothetical protein